MKSAINEAKLTVRFKTEDYAWEEYSLGAVVDDRETGVQVLKELKLQINEAFTGSAVKQEEETETKSSKKSDKKEEKKDAKSTKRGSSKDDSNDDETSDEEDGSDDGESSEDDEASNSKADDDSDDSADGGDDDAGDEDEKPKSKGKSAEKGKKKFKQKAQAYNRGIEQHKEIFSKLIGSLNSNWKKTDASKQKAKEASQGMESEPFLDENGEVLESFKKGVAKILGVKSK